MDLLQSWFGGTEKDNGCPVDEVSGRVLETPEIRVQGLAALREKMNEHKTTKGASYPRDDDQFLLAFLRARKYKIKDAFMLVNNFSQFWYDPKHADVINGLSAQRVRGVYELGIMELLLGAQDQHGNFCSALRIGNIDYKHPEYTPRNMIAMSLYFLLEVFEQEDYQLRGFSYVETFEGFSLINAVGMSRELATEEWKQVNALGIDTFPMRIRDIFVIHEPFYFDWFLTLVKPFMKAKLFKRMHLLGADVDKLAEFIPKEQLPKDFGGTREHPRTHFLDELEKKEKAIGMIGGFAVPLSVEDPTGALRNARTPATTADIGESS